ncbi:DUF3089 domain-containing protein [Polymorphobacter fuscus]|uniref:DUF3089 domain-containing protein n=1 Tax=Sandarakinorhabdus fusca TaxID=1439888 RepID=A0A7C9GTL2_9SPHN|nr:DUF3089 domain-containing protein [Polymorphobacter fuscus]KAB7648873.1 DUF3089 domain-containing protein [Polymorphobacter fuscus]MQT16458.1 DUF3089 domain-containing protein [Polymorphobacter fuscus]NJC07252.1 hypothetical protein [Polymorphobacter fuscus]
MRILLLAAMVAGPAAAQVPAAPDYTQDANWLCRPGRADACAGDIGVTSVAATGKAVVMPSPPATTPAIDCFYVYPTVSTDQGGNSDLGIDAAETNVAKAQFAPFRTVCRTFAPMYRQVTLQALRDAVAGKPTTADRAMAYRDVVAAWTDYLARDNQGRGVILVGHSQGSGILKALLQGEIEGKPVARQLIAAYLPGTNLLVPAGKDVGGDLASTPLCRGTRQTGCVVTWVSFRAGKTPPADSRFGRSPKPGMDVACVNPAAPAGGSAPLTALLPAGPAIVDNAAPQAPWAKGLAVTTPFVTLPGLLRGACTAVDGANVLAVAVNAAPGSPRTDSIGGDVVAGGRVVESWGLHLIDVNVALGDLVALAHHQGQAWRASR